MRGETALLVCQADCRVPAEASEGGMVWNMMAASAFIMAVMSAPPIHTTGPPSAGSNSWLRNNSIFSFYNEGAKVTLTRPLTLVALSFCNRTMTRFPRSMSSAVICCSIRIGLLALRRA